MVCGSLKESLSYCIVCGVVDYVIMWLMNLYLQKDPLLSSPAVSGKSVNLTFISIAN